MKRVREVRGMDGWSETMHRDTSTVTHNTYSRQVKWHIDDQVGQIGIIIN